MAGETIVEKEPHLLYGRSWAVSLLLAAGVAAPGNDRADIKVTEPG